MAFEQCRTLGHAWEIRSVVHNGGVARLSLGCVRCETTRVDTISRGSGGLAGRAYAYIAGYQYTHKGDEVPSRDEFRTRLLALLERGKA